MGTYKNQIVYLFRHKDTNYVKIGFTLQNDCYDRFQSFCTYSPNGGEIVGTIKTNSARKLEKEIHEKYKHKRLKGEFFELTQDECDLILKKHKSQIVEDVIKKIRIAESEGNFNLLEKINSFFYKKHKDVGLENEQIIADLFIHNPNSYMTATEVSQHIYDKKNIHIHPIVCGKILNKMMFDKKRIKKNNTVITVYLINKL